MTKERYDVVIIGGGIIGASIAYKLARYKLNILVLEKNPYLAEETSSANSAGHYADKIAKLASQGNFELTARRGEYKILSRSESSCLKAVYFLVPTIHGKGVLVAPLLNGKVLVGPTSEDSVPKSDTRVTTSKKQAEISKIGRLLLPKLNMDKVEMTFAGSRPIYSKTDDFLIGYGNNNKNFINVAGMQSPAIASAPAIANEVKMLLASNGSKLQKNPLFQARYTLMY
ncbi:uncharacterized protein LOC111627157 [Centruroides sculpturatus]|uniref:uncharacterized protein LOC111627157 n=1 Tax=Centruroides sculpturatus TaxID=218467 RepID=UPI000C6D4C45|nr:uncharacterized protein LOC111627157 [Centruroides sculpturatus]